MAFVHYKFKSAKKYDSLAIEDHFISVGLLKEKIFELKHLGRGTDFDLVVTNSQTNEEYLDEGMLIPKNASVLIRRVPGLPRKPIVIAPITEQEEGPILERNSDDAVKGSFSGVEASSMKYAEDIDWDEFGNDIYAIPATVSSQLSIQDAPPVTKEDEDTKIKALIDTPALDWQHQPCDGFGPCRDSGRGKGGRITGANGSGRCGFDQKTPPKGYICHRCKVPGHFIQHCPTNGDPTYDIKRVKPPTGIPRSMLIASPDGSYALPSGAVAVLKPNEAAFEKEMEGISSTRSFVNLPPELHCPMCKEIMKDAVFASKCCYTSYCDKCIREYIISKSNCICGATNILADDLLPNKTLRNTINRILESNSGSSGNTGSSFQVQGMESRNPKDKVPSPTKSAASKEHQLRAPSLKRKETSSDEQNKSANALPKQEKRESPKLLDVSIVTNGSRIVKEEPLHESAQLVESVDGGKKKKRKKVHIPPSAIEMHSISAQDLAPENYMMSSGPCAYNPHWNGIQPGLDGFMPSSYHPGHMPYMGYGFSPMDVSFGGVLPQNPFGCMLPYGPPQRQLSVGLPRF